MKMYLASFSRSTQAALLTASLFGAAFVGLADEAVAQAPPTNGWFKVCSKQEENDICNVQFRSMAPNGQLITGVSLAEIKGQINRRVFQIQVPTGRFIPTGIKVKVDDNKEVTVPYSLCFQHACMAEVQLDDNLVALLKGGSNMLITSTNFQNKPNPVEVTLGGFTAAYDGPPLKQDELVARQRKLQEELQQKAEEQRKRLQEEMEKAKQATE